MPSEASLPSELSSARRDQTVPCPAAGGETRYHPALGVLRVTAAFGVVAIHIFGLWFKAVTPLSAAWWTTEFYDASTRGCVPVFIMISGALLLQPQRLQPPGVFYRKRMARILIPLVFWTVFYLGLRVFTEGLPWALAGRDLVRGNAYGHLWYLYAITGLYGITPILQPFVRTASRRSLTWTVAVLLAAACAHHLINSLTNGHGKPTVFSLFVTYIPYYLCGYLLSQIVVPRRWIKYLALGVLASWLGIALGTGLLLTHVGLYFSTHYSVLVVPLSVGVFLLVAGLVTEPGGGPENPRTILRYLDRLSFGVYLVHPFALFLLMRLGIPTTQMLGQPLLSVPVVAALLIVASVLLTSLLKAIPIVRRIV